MCSHSVNAVNSYVTMQSNTPTIQGKVIRSAGAWYHVKGENGLCYTCQLKGKLRFCMPEFINAVVVGDEVVFAPEGTQAPGMIYEVIPRKNSLIRQDTHRKACGKLLAANLDQAILVVTAVAAPTQLDFINRFLVVTEASEIMPLLVFSKIDLLNTIQHEALELIKRLYKKLGYVTLAVSVHAKKNVVAFGQALSGKVSLLSGHSGVGKSTLVNTVAPAANQAVATHAILSQKGQHTTTYTALFEISPNTFVIDMPGIQTFIPYAIKKKTLSHYFPEMRSRAAACKFHNCTHQHEPACAVRQALASGDIASSRYKSYHRLLVADNE